MHTIKVKMILQAFFLDMKVELETMHLQAKNNLLNLFSITLYSKFKALSPS